MDANRIMIILLQIIARIRAVGTWIMRSVLPQITIRANETILCQGAVKPGKDEKNRDCIFCSSPTIPSDLPAFQGDIFRSQRTFGNTATERKRCDSKLAFSNANPAGPIEELNEHPLDDVGGPITGLRPNAFQTTKRAHSQTIPPPSEPRKIAPIDISNGTLPQRRSFTEGLREHDYFMWIMHRQSAWDNVETSQKPAKDAGLLHKTNVTVHEERRELSTPTGDQIQSEPPQAEFLINDEDTCADEAELKTRQNETLEGGHRDESDSSDFSRPSRTKVTKRGWRIYLEEGKDKDLIISITDDSTPPSLSVYKEIMLHVSGGGYPVQKQEYQVGAVGFDPTNMVFSPFYNIL